MLRKVLAVSLVIGLAHSISAAADTPAANGKLSAAAIVEKNVAARGGLQAWRAVQTMSMQGRLGAGGNRRATVPVPIPGQKSSRQSLPTRPAEEVQLPVIIELKRPGKILIEL